MIVDAPRSSLASPVTFWTAAAAMAAGSNPSFVPERPVLGGRGGVEDELGHLVVGHDAALLALEPRELDLAGPVVDDRRLGEGQRLEVRLGQARP